MIKDTLTYSQSDVKLLWMEMLQLTDLSSKVAQTGFHHRCNTGPITDFPWHEAVAPMLGKMKSHLTASLTSRGAHQSETMILQ